MNKLRVAIVEDEIPAARLLRTLIARLRPAWEIEVLPGSVEEAVQWFAANRHPDLLFLDIQLADGTSFELLSQARPSSAVVFTTAYDEYAVRAFSVSSIDYILKPVDEDVWPKPSRVMRSSGGGCCRPTTTSRRCSMPCNGVKSASAPGF